MKRFFQGLLILVGVFTAIIIVAAAPGVLILVAFVFLCWGIGRLVFGKSESKVRVERPQRNYVEPAKQVASGAASSIGKLFTATHQKLIKPAVEEAKASISAKRKLRELEEELETLKREKEFESRLNKKADAED
jgi:hypothetical protein